MRLLNVRKTLATYLPVNRGFLRPFLVIVEVISSIIRPLTLSFRLAANITAGHVILGLISARAGPLLLQFNIFYLLLPMFYTIFEFIICGVQAYVFVILLIMYSNDYLLPVCVTNFR